ncbi:hypothetical protein [Erythrobacter rubeus]|uniref:Chromosomal replication initiator protein DnaA n=1 Tax=Erythrobacter rubeus TaxID=2760803 RepID=A0ABR8KTK6_9SPHN|nr:hypothetical protein [Erythrobacter rubeus]MBD2842690.1 hypothetical protein [Erythrobacter rubeus]
MSDASPLPGLIPSSVLVERACRYGNVPRSAVQSTKRKGRPRGPVSRLRWAVVHILRQQYPDRHLRALGRPVRIADHSSVLYAIKRADELVRHGDPDFQDLLAFLREGDGDDARSLPGWIERDPPAETGCDKINRAAMRLPTTDVFTSGKFDAVFGESGPIMPREELERRIAEVSERRFAHERAMIAAEQARYGMTRQTRARPLSGQPA